MKKEAILLMQRAGYYVVNDGIENICIIRKMRVRVHKPWQWQDVWCIEGAYNKHCTSLTKALEYLRNYYVFTNWPGPMRMLAK